MPEEGFKGQAQAQHIFSTEVFKLSTSDELMEMLNELSKPQEYGKLNDKWKFVVDKMKTEMELDRKVPSDFYEKNMLQSRMNRNRHGRWQKCIGLLNFEPHLEKMIELTKQMVPTDVLIWKYTIICWINTKKEWTVRQ